jgi:mRNA interferase RelE/StbE
MIVRIDKSFQKDLNKINDQKIKDSVVEIIRNIQLAQQLSAINNLKKLAGHKNKYRVRIGDYRIGIEYSENTLFFIRFLNRKEIYQKWP